MDIRKENIFVFCCQCGEHFPKDKTYSLHLKVKEIGNIARLSICKGCYETIPKKDDKGNLNKIE